MKSSRLLIPCLIVAIFPASSFFAGVKKAKPKPMEFHDTVIESVGADSITISQDKLSKNYKLTPFTEITFRGQKVTLADLKSGMSVSVTQGTDVMTAARIAASDPPMHNDPHPGKKK